MRWLLAALLVAGTSGAAAQQQPFDMTPERPPVEEAEPLPQPAPTEDEVEEEPEPEAAQPAQPVRPPQPPAEARRQLLPDGNLVLGGESASRSWAVHLTAAQAASAATLHLGYQNAVVAAPESSRLQVLINNTVVADQAVRSADGVASIEAAVPPGLLRAGRNDLTMRVRHRHRTDCTVASTYELWTEIYAAQTYLSFSDSAANTFLGVSDLRALAPDAEGRTMVEIVAPAMERLDMTADILRLAQAVALYANQTNLEFAIASAIDPERRDQSLRVLLGSLEELQMAAGTLPPGAAQGSVTTFLPRNGESVPTLVVSGRSREEWRAAIDQLLAPVDRAGGTRREALITESWRTPNAPIVYEQRNLTFAELGIPSEQFSGRRYMRSFTFAIPADFYAGSYGEARLLLDAAYSSAVLPGSSINVYVNGNIAASMQLTERRGAILNQMPIKVTMRHFRPGLNEVTVEAELLTEQDDACLPGAAADETPRFAVFDTSRFVMPDFGRIGQYPNLAATAGTGYPYGLANDPVAIVLERDDLAGISTAANMLARIALAAGRTIPVSATTSTDAARQQDAIFIGAINAIPAGVLGQVGVNEESRTSWTTAAAAPAGQGPDQASLDDWRRQMERPGFGDIGDWFSRTFGITIDMMRFTPTDDTAYIPSQADALLVAQGTNPAGNGVWTVIAAPSTDQLAAGSAGLADHRIWGQLSGKVTTLGSDLRTTMSRPVASASFVESQPPSFTNYRLIVANWLSANILSYSLLLVVACVLLGIGTSGLLSRLGRRR
jgi:hypothetical protein